MELWALHASERVGDYMSPPRGEVAEKLLYATQQIDAIWDAHALPPESKRNIWVRKPFPHAKEILRGVLNPNVRSDNADVQAMVELIRHEGMREWSFSLLSEHTGVYFDRNDQAITIGEEMAGRISKESLLLALLHEDGHDKYQLSPEQQRGRPTYEVARINECMADAHMNRLSPYGSQDTARFVAEFLQRGGRSSDPEFNGMLVSAYRMVVAQRRKTSQTLPPNAAEVNVDTHPKDESRLRAITDNAKALSLTGVRLSDSCEVVAPLSTPSHLRERDAQQPE